MVLKINRDPPQVRNREGQGQTRGSPISAEERGPKVEQWGGHKLWTDGDGGRKAQIAKVTERALTGP